MSVNIIYIMNLNSGILTQDSLPKLTLLANYKDSQMQTLTQLEMDISELDKYCQELVENRRNEEQRILTEKIEVGVQQLTIIAEKINILANEIKTLMFSFKEIAVEVNRNYHLMQQSFNLSLTKLDQSKRRLRHLNIWDIHDSSIPTVIRCGAKFILTKKIVDLFNP